MIDVYVFARQRSCGRVYADVQRIVGTGAELPPNTKIDVRGTVQAMRSSFKSFGLGLILSTVLVYT